MDYLFPLPYIKNPLYIHISKKDDGGPIELKNPASYLIYSCKSWAPPIAGVYIFHTMHNLSYSQLGMSKVSKAAMQVYGRKSPYPSQRKHIMLAMFLTYFPKIPVGCFSWGEDMGPDGVLGGPGMVMLPCYEALTFLIRDCTKYYQPYCTCNCG